MSGSRRLALIVLVVVIALAAANALLGKDEPLVAHTPDTTPAPAPTPAWRANAVAFLWCWSFGDYPRAAKYATPALAAALAMADPAKAPRVVPGVIEEWATPDEHTWVLARAAVGENTVLLDLSWDGTRWVVANIEPA